MTWYFLVYGLFLLAGIQSLIANAQWRNAFGKVVFPFLFVAWFAFAVSRSPWVDHDYQNYLDWFQRIASGNALDDIWTNDPVFIFLCRFVSVFHGTYVTVLCIYTGSALATLWLFVRSARPDRWSALVLYVILCHYFVAHDLTEIRAALAIPLASYALILAVENRHLSPAVFMLFAVAIHMSALLLFPFVFLFERGFRVESRRWIWFLLPTTLLVRPVIVQLMPFLMLTDRLAIYSSGAYAFEPIPLVSVYAIARVLSLSIVCIFLWNRMSARDKQITLCSAVGFVVFLALSSWDTFAWRASEVFGLFDMAVLVLPVVYLKGSFRLVYLFTLLALGFEFFRSSLQLVGPYSI